MAFVLTTFMLVGVALACSTPKLTTQASPSVTVGSPIYDTAYLSNGYYPQGTITFKLYGPNNSTCSGSPIIPANSVNVTNNGTFVSPSFIPTQPGTYRWVASYVSSNGNNYSVSGHCNDSNESVVVTKKSPAISTTASESVEVGGNITDTAHLSGTFSATGTISFTLYGPDDATCTTGAISTTSVAVAGNADYTSAAFTTTQAGTYRWIASYSGDANNGAVSGACNDSSESVVVAGPPPTVQPQVEPAVTILGQKTCVSKKFRISTSVTNGTVASMTLYVDGKRKASGKSGSFVIDSRKYKPGTHRVKVKTVLTNGRTIITTGTFDRCKTRTTKKRITPRFTG